MSDTIDDDKNFQKQRVLQTRLGSFLQELAKEVGEAPLAAVMVVHWTTSVSTAATLAKVPKETMFTMISKMSRDLVAHLERLRTQIRTYKAPSAQ